MIRLFSRFDLKLFFSGAVLILFSFCHLLNTSWKVSIMFSSVYGTIQRTFLEFFYSLKPKEFSKSLYSYLFAFFVFLLLNNFSSVFSFNFPLTRQVSTVFLASLRFWSSLIIWMIAKKCGGFLSHSIPEGTPMLLVPFLFAIELIRNSIRPLTLTVRLVANILAGHLLLTLLSGLVFTAFPFFIFYMALNAVETVVAVIQAYIFVTMIALYYSEV